LTQRSTNMIRKVIIHYHLFKNAGTSVDKLLKVNFPNRWVTREFPDGPRQGKIAQVESWVRQEQDATAFSSHTAPLPPPTIDGLEVFPILFVRHPIDRIASVYAFERVQAQNGVSGFGAVLARNTTMAGYIEVRLSLGGDRQCRNFHVGRLAQVFTGVARPEGGDETELALRALEALPFVGSVEKFDQSIDKLRIWLTPHFPDFQSIAVAENVTSDRSIPMEQRLEKIRLEIGDDLYRVLCDANSGDLAVYEDVRNRIG
jgi:hypothetical protein